MPFTLQELLEELTEMEEANEKLKFLLALAKELPEFLESEKTEASKISGCASNAYIVIECKDGKLFFRGDADAQIPKGLLALFIFGCEESTPQEIAEITPDIFEKAGIKNILSPSRANGAYHIFQRIQEEAKRYL